MAADSLELASENLGRILVVEDELEMGRLLSRGLGDEGYEVELATDGVQALVLAGKGEFALAVLDVMLPGMSGLELCRRLRAAIPALPILLLTARDAVEDRVRGLDAGADDYLVKPFTLSELAARLRAIRRREVLAPAKRTRVGRLTIDNRDHLVRVGSTKLSLSPKEFALLRLLAQHANEVVTREHILQEIWGTTDNRDANVVDQYMSYLRRKLEPLDSGVLLATRRGVGFELESRPA
ncbi:MAG: response regulator transcription factor [Rhodoglobus sp.]